MKNKIGPILTILVLTSASMAAQKVTTKYDRNYDFSKVKTFTIKVEPSWSNSALEAYVEKIVGQELQAKGWTQAPDASSADVRVVIQGTVKTREYEETYYDGGIIGISGNSSPPEVTNGRTIKEKLAQGKIEVFDSRTNELVFSGAAEDEVSSKERKNEHRIKKGVEKVFKDFPSRTGRSAILEIPARVVVEDIEKRIGIGSFVAWGAGSLLHPGMTVRPSGGGA